ncbi:MAG: ASKHA domain-containing protein [Defluviitaleaceae bacterium]|nr:ASKHA domain-containing protein [Defluviitaleaceae bacterium]
MEIVQYYENGEDFAPRPREGYGIALDIGTTTLAFELFDLTDGKRLAAYSSANSQREYGADVITRIKRAAQGAAGTLHTYIIEDIRNGVARLLAQTGVPASEVRDMTAAGNTTMLHLLHDWPCDTLGVYPFTPVKIGSHNTRFAFLPNCGVLTLPGISVFVGADITAGIYFLGGMKDETCLFIDLGTNGEMALVRQGKIFTASAAAGPAFEAGNISQGVASVEGAITCALLGHKLNKFDYKTIGGVPPIGICGTGVVDIMAELVRRGMVDETGRLSSGFPDKRVEIAPDIFFTQGDVREVQLAKSAVRAGIEILLQSAGCTPDDINRVCLAGGFGYRINIGNAETIGLLPKGLAEKTHAVGNAALGGAAKSLLTADLAGAEAIAARAVEVNLAAHPAFNDLFMEYMMFS